MKPEEVMGIVFEVLDRYNLGGQFDGIIEEIKKEYEVRTKTTA